MCNTEIGYFCSTHENWAELLAEEPYFLKIKEDGEFVMFSYDQIRSCFMYELVREARGIIFRKGEWTNPVCWAFNKFGNYGESYVPNINWDTAFVTEKIDGSLIKLWHDGRDWRISTNGTIEAFKAETGDAIYGNFGSYFYATVCKYYGIFDEFLLQLDQNLTYMFELVGPYNRVVVPYDEPDVYFLGARNKYTGEEFNCSPLIAGALGVGRFKLPKQYPLTSLEECIRVADEFSWDQEGFVVADAEFNRVKVKSPSYILAHYTRNNNIITKKHLIRVIISNETEEFLCYAADYKDALEEMQKKITAFLNIGNKLAEACRLLVDKLERKDYARLVEALPKVFRGLLYCNYDRHMSMQEYTQKWNENKWEDNLIAFEDLIEGCTQEGINEGD
jgi:T4 RnlA family RNA ligase